MSTYREGGRREGGRREGGREGREGGRETPIVKLLKCPPTLHLSHFCRRVFAMMQYNSDTHEIARPSEVLARIQSYMSALRTLELYVTIDMTRVLTAVLLQETQLLDSKGEATLASSYTSWWVHGPH